jgi:hypothetical protein
MLKEVNVRLKQMRLADRRAFGTIYVLRLA